MHDNLKLLWRVNIVVSLKWLDGCLTAVHSIQEVAAAAAVVQCLLCYHNDFVLSADK
jgi:hypothetical protein